MPQLPTIIDDVLRLRQRRYRSYDALVTRLAIGKPDKTDTPDAIDALLRDCGVSFERFVADVAKGTASGTDEGSVLLKALEADRRQLNSQRQACQTEVSSARRSMAAVREVQEAISGNKPVSILDGQTPKAVPKSRLEEAKKQLTDRLGAGKQCIADREKCIRAIAGELRAIDLRIKAIRTGRAAVAA